MSPLLGCRACWVVFVGVWQFKGQLRFARAKASSSTAGGCRAGPGCRGVLLYMHASKFCEAWEKDGVGQGDEVVLCLHRLP